MTIAQAKAELARDYRWAGQKAVRFLLVKGVEIADVRSSGKLSLNEMARKYLDHPYAKRHNKIRVLDHTIVNEHSGAFRLGWYKDETSTAHDIGGAIINDSENADRLQEGTKFMLGRDIQGDISKRIEKLLPEAEKVFQKELERGNT